MSSKDFAIMAHDNGSKTLVDLETRQAMHSRIGPQKEARWVYADAARIEDSLVSPGSRHVLYDVGMGTGANAIAVLDRLVENSESTEGPSGYLEIHSFESKPEGLAFALARLEDFPLLAPWAETLTELLKTGCAKLEIATTSIEWTLHRGDFYETLPQESLAGPDTVFFDFYSPKVVPELWSRERFSELRRKIEDRKARLFTYSAATPVRLNLLLAGFFIGQGRSTGMKNETTVAATRVDLLESPLKAEWLRKLETSTSIPPAIDKDEVRRHPQWH